MLKTGVIPVRWPRPRLTALRLGAGGVWRACGGGL